MASHHWTFRTESDTRRTYMIYECLNCDKVVVDKVGSNYPVGECSLSKVYRLVREDSGLVAN